MKSGDSPEQSQRITARIKEEVARRRLSRQAVADMAKISLSTLDKALSGSRSLTLATVVRLEDALVMNLRDASPLSAPTASQTAPENLGSYARAGVSWIEQEYRAIRPDFKDASIVRCYAITIGWDDENSCLAFQETRRQDAEFSQRGFVSIPHLSNHIYLITNEQGQVRTMTFGRPTIDGTMYGLLSSLMIGHGSQLVPVACPIVLVPLAGQSGDCGGAIGRDSPLFNDYRELLNSAVAQEYCRIVS